MYGLHGNGIEYLDLERSTCDGSSNRTLQLCRSFDYLTTFWKLCALCDLEYLGHIVVFNCLNGSMDQLARASLRECVVLNVAGSIPGRTLNFDQYISPGTASVRSLILSILSPHRPAVRVNG